MIANFSVLADAVTPLCAWYRENRKPLPWRTDKSPYHVWLSEIMLQQTRIEAVIPYYHRFLDTLPTIEDLANCPDDLLMKLWEGLGYYSRVRNLKRAAILICDEHGGSLPNTFQELKKLPGIGDYTAGAIASIAYGLPEPAVDGNVLRVVSRLCTYDEDVMLPATKKRVTDQLRAIYPTGENAGELTQALMELGEIVCIPNGRPKCECCPVRTQCCAYQADVVESLPKKSPKKAKKDLFKTVFLLECNGKIALTKRPRDGLLGGLWEFPNIEGHLSPLEAEQFVRLQQTEPLSCEKCGEAKHIFTHLIWNMIGYRITCDYPSEAFVWVSPKDLDDTYALPTAFRFYRKQLL